MQFRVTETIGAQRDDVLRALVDPEFFAHLGTVATAVREPELLSASVDGGILHSRVRYAFIGTLSGPAALVVDADKLTWIIETRYDTTAHTGTLVVVPDHYVGMLQCRGTVTFEEADGATRETVTGSLEVRIPLVSGSAERAILAGFTQHLRTEAEALAAYCGSGR